MLKAPRTGLVVVAGVGGVAVNGAVASAAAKPCHMQVVREGATGVCVQTIQILINRCAPQTTRVDGVFGRGTATALIAVQKRLGLRPDAIVGRETWPKLHGCHPGMSFLARRSTQCRAYGLDQRQGQRSQCVLHVQRSLNACWGRKVVDTTGYFDARTTHVVKVLQFRNKLNPDGVVGINTWPAIDRCNGPALGTNAASNAALPTGARPINHRR